MASWRWKRRIGLGARAVLLLEIPYGWWQAVQPLGVVTFVHVGLMFASAGLAGALATWAARCPHCRADAATELDCELLLRACPGCGAQT